MNQDLIHFRPSSQTRNVRCLNGSAHVQTSSDINKVTCPLCKDSKTNAEFWISKGVYRFTMDDNDERLMRNRESR